MLERYICFFPRKFKVVVEHKHLCIVDKSKTSTTGEKFSLYPHLMMYLFNSKSIVAIYSKEKMVKVMAVLNAF